MTDESFGGVGEALPGTTDDSPKKPAEKMGLGFYAALALIGILVLMVVVLNYPAARANAGIVMTETPWTLRSYSDAAGVHIPAGSGTETTARFDRDGQMSGTAGCNRYTAAYETHDYSITISDISSTEMACQGPGVMEQESAFLADLEKAASFRVSESFLNLYDDAGTPVLVFVPA